MIPNEIAYHIRFERCLLLPTDQEYDNPRIKQIAIEQKSLIERIAELDVELIAICGQPAGDENDDTLA